MKSILLSTVFTLLSLSRGSQARHEPRPGQEHALRRSASPQPLTFPWNRLAPPRDGFARGGPPPPTIHSASHGAGRVLERRQSSNASGVLVNFQVQNPPVVPHGGCEETVTLLVHDFAFSYGIPAVTEYTPPSKCENWAAVTLNITVTSNGTQFDRLGLLYLNDVEIWRTSTAEPTRAGIIWTVVKDVSKYIPLLKNPGTLLFDEGNLIDNTYTGIFHTIVTATFYGSTKTFPVPETADLILPLSRQQTDEGQGSVFSTPPSGQTNVTFPINAAEAYVEIFASGNSNEEFWYTNAVNEALPYFPDGALLGNGPYREAQLFIDSKLAGVAYVFPVIYTGGIILSIWRPMAAYGAFDAPTYWIDITPFLPLLTDSKPHNFTLSVAGQGPERTTYANWFISGNIVVKLDKSPKRTTGKMLYYHAPDFIDPKTTVKATADNATVTEVVTAKRNIKISSTIVTGSGQVKLVDFEQDLEFYNQQIYKDQAYYEASYVHQEQKGITKSTHNGIVTLLDSFSYPLNVEANYGDAVGYVGSINHTYTRTLKEPDLAAGGHQTFIDTTQKGFGTLFITNDVISSTIGDTQEVFKYLDLRGNSYTRNVHVANNTVLYDKEGGSLAGKGKRALDLDFEDDDEFVLKRAIDAVGIIGTLDAPVQADDGFVPTTFGRPRLSINAKEGRLDTQN
ncbi:hypothetical protein BT69DRAFT_1260721 [Atractiella rhizophila]|nr:hypothetical protein BT69DRAFT_1260721 [Atractiella rhizophila]